MQYSIRENLRIVQTKNPSDENILIIDNAKGEKYKINKPLYDIVAFINEKVIPVNKLNDSLQKKFKFDSKTIKEITNYLQQENIIIPTREKRKNQNIFKLYKGEYILSRLALEISSHCNLKCRHCYGAFGKTRGRFLALDFIKSIIPELDKLNTHSVALTGGEFFIHPNYNEIFDLFKSKGYRLSIMTNGLLSGDIKNFILSNKDVSFLLKVSLDGFEKTHNYVRQNSQSYQRAFETLTYLKDFPNIDTYISISISKHNLNEIRDFLKFITKEFRFNTSIDLIFPTENNQHFHDMILKPEDFEELNDKYPEYFLKKSSGGSKINKNSIRCVGGIEMATISADKTLKICNNAVSECFQFGSLEDNSLTYLWEHPPTHIDFFRKEKISDIKGCRECKFYDQCFMTNCRTLAYYYTGDYTNPNPIICFAKAKYENNNS